MAKRGSSPISGEGFSPDVFGIAQEQPARGFDDLARYSVAV